MTKEKMIQEAKRNFEYAQEYDQVLLDNKRNNFYNQFRNGDV